MKTKNEVKHTPTPWEIYDTTKTHKKGRVFITDAAVMLAELPRWGDGKDLANAAFIVRAVNSHEVLLEALKQLTNISRPKKNSVAASIVAQAWRAIALAEGTGE